MQIINLKNKIIEKNICFLPLWLCLFFMLGIIFYFDLNNEPKAGPILLINILLFCLIITKKAMKYKYLHASLLFSFFFLLGISSGVINVMLMPEFDNIFYKEEKLGIFGKIIDVKYSLEDDNYYSMIIITNPEILNYKDNKVNKVKGNIKLISKIYSDKNLQEGQVVALDAIVSTSNKNEIFSEDLQIYSYFTRIIMRGIIISEIVPLRTDPNIESSNFNLLISYLQGSIKNKILQNMKGDNAMLTLALIIGETISIKDKIKKNMRNSGLYHVVSVSGIHISLVAFISTGILRRFMLLFNIFFGFKNNSKKTSIILGLILIFFYLFLSGAEVATLRSFLMSSIIYSTMLLDKTTMIKATVIYSAILILFFAPYYIFSPSFQMSYSAVLALIGIQKFFYNLKYFLIRELKINENKIIPKLFFSFLGSMLSSFAASLATFVYVVRCFNINSNYSIIANLFATPIVSFAIMPLLFIIVLLMPFYDSKFLYYLLDKSIGYFLDISNYFGSLKGATTAFVSFPNFILLLVAISLVILVIANNPIKIIGLIPVIIVMLYYYCYSRPIAFYDAYYNIYGTLTKNQTFMISNKLIDTNRKKLYKKILLASKFKVDGNIFNTEKNLFHSVTKNYNINLPEINKNNIIYVLYSSNLRRAWGIIYSKNRPW